MKAPLEVYVSDWGVFPMPPGLSDKTEWDERMVEGWETGIWHKQRTPKNTEANKPFFDWLHAEETKAGKPS